jgi:hypothetical protein
VAIQGVEAGRGAIGGATRGARGVAAGKSVTVGGGQRTRHGGARKRSRTGTERTRRCYLHAMHPPRAHVAAALGAGGIGCWRWASVEWRRVETRAA